MAARYFDNLIDDKRLLQQHGLGCWPEGDELVRYVLDLEDGVQALANAFGVSLTKDLHGRWIVIPAHEEEL